MLPHFNLEVSIIGMGCAHIGKAYAGQEAITGRRAQQLVKHALDCGINFFDIAEDYGQEVKNQILGSGAILSEKTDKPKRSVYSTHLIVCHHPTTALIESGDFDGVSVYSVSDGQGAAQLGSKLIQFPWSILDQRHRGLFSSWVGFHRCKPDYATVARSILLRGKLASMAEEAIRWAAFSGPDVCLIGFRSEKEIDFACEAAAKGGLSLAEIVDPRKWEEAA